MCFLEGWWVVVAGWYWLDGMRMMGDTTTGVASQCNIDGGNGGKKAVYLHNVNFAGLDIGKLEWFFII